VFFARSDVKLDSSSIKNRIGRWRKIAVSEVAQSGGAFLPDIADAIPFRELIEKPEGPGILFDEESDGSGFGMELAEGMEIIALVGPEGGIERNESELAKNAGWIVASLGNWILRADLAGALVPLWMYSMAKKT
jgi:16S rRNA (uracil1498-N3)-methyltransferase